MRVLKQGFSSTKSLAYISLVCPIRKCGASCWDPYWEGQINALDRVQKKAAKFVNHTKDSAWETLAQRRQIARICSHFKAYTGERVWKATRDRFTGQCYLSRDDHDHKFRARTQRTDISKYRFVNRTIRLWTQLPAEALATFSCKSRVFRKRVREVTINEEKWGFWEGGDETSKSAGTLKMGSEVQCSAVKWIEVIWSEVMILMKCVYYPWCTVMQLYVQ